MSLYQYLGKSGLKVSRVILGAMSYGTPEWQDLYSHGQSEQVIGEAIKKYNIPRENLVILTKIYFGVTPNCPSNQPGMTAQNDDDLPQSKYCKTWNLFDVLQIHRIDRSIPREEIMRALNDVVESGKARYIGASSMAAWEFQQLQNIADRHGWHKFISMQNYFNLIYREEEHEMIPYCNYTGIGLIPWSPVARGALTRPWGTRNTLREEKDAGLHMLVRSRDDNVDEEIVNRVEEISKKLGKSMAQVAIAWTLSKNMCPVVGLNKKERIDDAVEATKIKLADDDLKYLEEPYLPRTRLEL
ncbi:NADP-dependent oxidoreductase domain-containing protein [Aspergillus alliaceus]|uniref:NADP-dependent oxidoreductase domain-containing protein n=1 Tax=Petromyces alliaceus TaxID=209559 RepID=A0A5N7BTN1_PETAA|nr:NADP-dependent oxidoreductase domain-containing protein [Aspergillus alliaceus]